MHARKTLRFSLPCSAALALFLASTLPASESNSVRLAQDVVPTFQAIELDVDADQSEYTGLVRIELDVRKATTTFRFHARDLKLKKVVLEGKTGPVLVTHKAGEHELIKVTAQSPLAPGEYSLEISFANEFNTLGVALYRTEAGGHGYVFSQFEATDARGAFPCWDEPAFKIPFQVTMTVPKDHLAVSNTPIETETTSGGSHKVTFMRTKPMPTYLLAMASGPFETVPIPGMSIPGRVITVKGDSHLAGEAVRTTPPILEALENYFGRPYPYRKLDLLAVPEYNFGAMENVGAVTYRDSLLLIDPKAASDRQLARLVGVTAHELAHMWFGDLVTLAWWDETWLNESFATWMGNKIADGVFPEYKIAARQARGVQRTMASDARLSTRPIRQPVDKLIMSNSFDELAYTKGGAVLGMFEEWVGEEVFRQGVRDYLKKHEWGNATASDFWRALNGAAKVDVGGAMSTFFDQAGVPLVTAKVLSDGRVQLSQERFLNFGVHAPTLEKPRWQIPVVLRWWDGETAQTEKVLLKDSVQTIRLKAAEKVGWIHPNAGEKGYYRWNIPAETLVSLMDNASDVLDVRERVALAGGLSALLDAGQLSGVDYMRLIRRLATDPRPEVVAAVPAALDKIRTSFVTRELEDAFAVYVRRVLQSTFYRVGVHKTPGEEEAVSMLRPTLLSWMGDEGQDREVLQFANGVAKKYVKDPTSVDPSIAGTCLNLSALDGGRGMYNTYREKFESARIPAERSRYLTAIGYFRHRVLVPDVLVYVFRGPLRVHEMFVIPGGVANSVRHRDQVFDWMMDNYKRITDRIPPTYAAYLPMFAGGCSEKRLRVAQTFFSNPAHVVPGTDRQLAKVAEAVTDCVALRKREGQAVADYLTRLYTGQ